MAIKTYPIFLASSNELKSERERFGNFINSENKRLQSKNVFLRLEVWEDMDDAFNTTCKQEDYNEYLAKCAICVVLFWTKVGKYTLKEYEQARKLSLDKKLRLYVYEKKAIPSSEPKLSESESKERFLNLLQENENEQFHGQFQDYIELENCFRKTLVGLFDSGYLKYGNRESILELIWRFVRNIIGIALIFASIVMFYFRWDVIYRWKEGDHNSPIQELVTPLFLLIIGALIFILRFKKK